MQLPMFTSQLNTGANMKTRIVKETTQAGQASYKVQVNKGWIFPDWKTIQEVKTSYGAVRYSIHGWSSAAGTNIFYSLEKAEEVRRGFIKDRKKYEQSVKANKVVKIEIIE